MSFWKLIWLFPLVVALHNAEEAVWLPGWNLRQGQIHNPDRSLGNLGRRWPVRYRLGRFCVVTTGLSVGVLLLTIASCQTGAQSVATHFLLAALLLTLFNIFFPHLLITVVTRRLMPGTATAVAFCLPVLTVLLVLAIRDQIGRFWPVMGATLLLAMLVALLASWTTERHTG